MPKRSLRTHAKPRGKSLLSWSQHQDRRNRIAWPLLQPNLQRRA
jgi:hypothetical protein